MKFITTINDTQFNNNGWKPLYTELILTTLSICDLSHVLFKHGYEFILTHRFAQDAVENVFFHRCVDVQVNCLLQQTA